MHEMLSSNGELSSESWQSWKRKNRKRCLHTFFQSFKKREKGGRGCDPVCRVGGSGANRDCDKQGFFSFFLSQDFEIVTTKGSNIPRLCRVGECEECEKEKKCECECENCKEVRIGNVTHCSFVFLHICTFLYFLYTDIFAYFHSCTAYISQAPQPTCFWKWKFQVRRGPCLNLPRLTQHCSCTSILFFISFTFCGRWTWFIFDEEPSVKLNLKSLEDA